MAEAYPVAAKAAILQRENGAAIAYHHTPGAAPGVVFCTGFRSDMQGGKALALEAHCRSKGQQCTRFDFQGHGESSGDFLACTIGEWLADTLAVLDGVTEGPQIVVGSSMGGWIALLAARARPEKVAGVVGIAAAVDLTRRLWNRIDDATRSVLQSKGVWMRPSEYEAAGYPITMKLIQEGARHLLLPGPIPFDGPVRLLHGQRDDAVPWQLSLEVAAALTGGSVEVTLVKDGDHRLSRDVDIARLLRTVDEVTDRLREDPASLPGMSAISG
jgi:pimeloyl-ACP methyl ester carboxylesterase